MTTCGAFVALGLVPVCSWPYLSGEVAASRPRRTDSVGRPIVLPVRDGLGRSSPQGPYRLVYAGECDWCSLRSVNLDELPASPEFPTCVVFSENLSDAILRKVHRAGLYVHGVPGWEVASGLMPPWTGYWWTVRDGRIAEAARDMRDEVPQ